MKISESDHQIVLGALDSLGVALAEHDHGHPKAKRAYAWTYRDGDQNKTVAVLEIPPVDSAENAVKVAIAAKARKNE